MTTQAEWGRDFYAAAEELGYYVESITAGSVTLVDPKTGLKVTLSSVLLNGEWLRGLLRPLKKETQ
jgi:hypothetical protein